MIVFNWRPERAAWFVFSTFAQYLFEDFIVDKGTLSMNLNQLKRCVAR